MGVFFFDDLTHKQSKVILERYASVVDTTYDLRQLEVNSLRREITVLTSYLQKMKEAEIAYFDKNNILQELTMDAGNIEDGNMVPHRLSTAPTYQESYGNSVMLQFRDVPTLEDNKATIRDDGTVFSLPTITKAMDEARGKIKDIEGILLRYDHIIKQTLLKLNMKRSRLERLLEEKQSVDGADNG